MGRCGVSFNLYESIALICTTHLNVSHPAANAVGGTHFRAPGASKPQIYMSRRLFGLLTARFAAFKGWP